MREILCEECGDVALEYQGSVDALDQTKWVCQYCGVIGRVSVDADESGGYVRFYPLDEGELLNVDPDLVMEAYIKSQEVITDLCADPGNCN